MFCPNCRTLNVDASTLCCKCGSFVRHRTAMLHSPHEEVRQIIQVGAVLCYLMAALHLYELSVATDWSFRFVSAFGAGLCAVVAWKLWTSGSFAVGIVAFA